MTFRTAQEAVTALVDTRTGAPSADLLRLIEIHGGQLSQAGLIELREETQRLWVPKEKQGHPIKVFGNENFFAERDKQYSPSAQEESWHLLRGLGFLDCFCPRESRYTHILAHGTLPQQAAENFRVLGRRGLNAAVGAASSIFLLSGPLHLPQTQKDRFCRILGIPHTTTTTELGAMVRLWQRLREPLGFGRMRVHAISSCDAYSPRGEQIIPDTLGSLNAMWQCRVRPEGLDQEDEVFRNGLNFFHSHSVILNLAATRRQLLRQHVVTRSFFKQRGVHCLIETVCGDQTKEHLLSLALREVAALIWALCKEKGLIAP